jgi:hypothetical protein
VHAKKRFSSPSCGQRDGDPSAAEVDHRDDGSRRVVPIAPVVDEADLGGQPFQLGVGQAELDRLDDSLAMEADGAGELDHGGDSAATGSGEPGIEVGVGPAPRWQPVEVSQLFFEHPCPPGDVALAAEALEGLGLLGTEPGRVFEQRPAGALELAVGVRRRRRSRPSGPFSGRPARRSSFQALRRTWSTAALASLTTWNGSRHTWAWGARASMALR